MRYILATLLALLGCNAVEPKKEGIIFIIQEDDVLKYPKIVSGMEIARKEWEEALGVPINIISGNPSPYQTAIDIRDNLNDLSPDVVGAWIAEINTLVLDSTFIDSEEKARAVVLHEMGHHFGVPHLDSEASFLFGSPVDYETLVMYPYMSDKNINSKLSKIEIRIAHGKLFR